MRVLAAWLIVLAGFGALALTLGGDFDDSFTIPKASSIEALKTLAITFPEAADSAALIVVTAPPDTTFNDPDIARAVKAYLRDFETLSYVKGVQDPYNQYVTGSISDDGTHALIRVRVDGTVSTFTNAQRDELAAQAQSLTERLPGSQVSVGGEVYSLHLPRLSPTEGIGVLVALAVLIIALGGLLGAVMPLGSALTGVGVTISLVVIGTSVISIMSSTLMLAVMLALAVGIDYSLFIISRHRTQLATGMAPEESAARAVATAGSAVVFAGSTVVVALIGLAIANLPFLTIMGMFTAFGVALEVLLALTLLPAFLGFAGARLAPRPHRQPRRQQAKDPNRSPWSERMALKWVTLATKKPLVTVLVIVIGLGALAIPAKDLHLALPTAGQSAPGDTDRVTYDLVAEHFGVGMNGPLIVTASIIETDDLLGLLEGLPAEIEAMEGVRRVAAATPNANIDTLMVQIIPTTGPDDPATVGLVERLRAKHDQWELTYGIDTAVTGFTAAEIDVSARLRAALLPFALFVVGLSFILLMVAFRSIWVPVKAALGYLLSVGAAFGATTLVFNKGYAKGIINLAEAGPVISFLPIILMGILFGLAMDYEVFLTSRMREEYAIGNTKRWIEDGFVHSVKVVAAAGFIMFSVFAFFVPAATGIVKPIAFGLAVGVAFDAFIVRMTLGPAIMKLMGARAAWWLPKWLDRRLPHLDIEGEALAHLTALANWPAPGDKAVIYAEDLRGEAGGRLLFDIPNLRLEAGEHLVVRGEATARLALVYALSGRAKATTGRLKVLGRILPEESSFVRVKTPIVTAATAGIASELEPGWGGIVFVPDLEELDETSRAVIDAHLQAAIPDATTWVLGLNPHTDLPPSISGSNIRIVTLEGRS
ncbi:MAG: MMPL family transporter [Propionibacteriaceae bacterium]|nr:MMPL family transporter [Propionibacteriaceae bacterium]